MLPREEQTQSKRSKGWRAGALAVMVGFGVWFTAAPARHLDTSEQAPRPSAIERLFGASVPGYFDTLGVEEGAPAEGDAGDVRQSRAQLDAEANEVLGAHTASFLIALFDQAAAAQQSQVAGESLIRTVDALNDALERERLSYFLDLEVRHHRGRLSLRVVPFRVREVRAYRTGLKRRRAIVVDHLVRSWRPQLGFTRPQFRDALVVADRVEQLLARRVLPLCAADAGLPLPEDLPQSTAVRQVARQAAEAVCTELVAVCGEHVSSLGQRLADRGSLLSQWRERFTDLRVYEPEGLGQDVARYEGLRSRLLESEWRDFEQLARELEQEDFRTAFACLSDAFVDVVAHHELQHRLDLRSAHRHASGQTPWEQALRAQQRPLALVGSEVSAYLSELVREDALRHTRLVLLGEHVFRRATGREPTALAGVEVLRSLGQHLGEDVEISEGLEILRPRAVALLGRLLAVDKERLGESAEHLWREGFPQGELPAMSEALDGETMLAPEGLVLPK